MRPSATKKNIAFVLPGLNAGGAERVLITLMNGLDPVRFQSSLISVKGHGDLSHLVSKDTPFYTCNQTLSPLTLPCLYRHLKKVQPDVVISTMTHMNFAVLALKPFFPQTTFIVREAITPSFFLSKFNTRQIPLRFLYHTLYPRADLVLSPTQKVFDEFENDLDLRLKHTKVLKNPVNLERMRHRIEKESLPQRSVGQRLFVACGRLHPQKGFDRLIAALAKAKMPFDWHLNILGEGAQRPALEQLIKECGLEDKITLKGLVLPPHFDFASADMFLLPSRFEGLPNVVLEALSCGAPVLAMAEAGGIAEIAEECAPDDLTIVNTIEDFVAVLQKTPETTQDNLPQPSKLPMIYHQDTIAQTFCDAMRAAMSVQSE